MGVPRSTAIVFAALLVAPQISAQGQRPRPTAALVLSEGRVYVNDKAVEPGTVPFALPDAATVRSGQSRAAIELKHGGWLFLDAESSARVLANGVYNFNRLEVLTGSAIVASATSSPLVDCENEIRLSSGGVFRFDAQPVNAQGERTCHFRVYEGAAAVPLVSVTNALRAGQSMMCNRRCGDMIQTTEFSPSERDAFDEWARQSQRQLAK